MNENVEMVYGKCKKICNNEQDLSSSKSTAITEVSKIYVSKGDF
jgi:hypothetical protein